MDQKMKFLSNCLSIVILDQPEFVKKSIQQVNESEKITLARDIVSNPLSDASWYYGTQLLKTQTSVKTTTYTIENTTCTDTKNYTLVASNGIGNTVTATVELIVNCKICITLNPYLFLVICRAIAWQVHYNIVLIIFMISYSMFTGTVI